MLSNSRLQQGGPGVLLPPLPLLPALLVMLAGARTTSTAKPLQTAVQQQQRRQQQWGLVVAVPCGAS